MMRSLTMMAVAIAVGGALLASDPASAGIAVPRIVSTVPASTTPQLVVTQAQGHPAAYGVTQSSDGATMYVGGTFTAVLSTTGVTYARSNIVAFATSSGAVTSFAPVVNGPVWAIRTSGSSVYLAGEFTTVNGVPRRGLAKLSAATGLVDLGFTAPWATGKAYDLGFAGGRLVVGGTFAGALLAVSPTTGADTGLIHIPVSGTEAAGQPTRVYRFAISPSGTRLVAIGNFLSPRHQALMVDLTTGALASWSYAPFAKKCTAPKIPAPLRDVDFAPDSSYFVIVATGGAAPKSGIGTQVCDAAARFETAIPNPARATWINYTGGDTLHSVTVTTGAVYVQGHQRWLNNPQGHDSCQTTCVPRQGIGAIDPSSGLALSWNPGKGRGVGGRDLLLTAQGLWVMSDTAQIGGRTHYGIALMPEPAA